MLKAYVRRLDGTTFPVDWQHTGQHLGVTEGSVRVARLYWETDRVQSPIPGSALDDLAKDQTAKARLMDTAPLLDILILTRPAQDGSERVVFHGLIHEVTGDANLTSLIAADNPTVQRLFDQPWQMDGMLVATDQQHPADAQQRPAQAAPPVPQFPSGGLANLAGAFPGVRPLSAVGAPGRPAGRPGGHPDPEGHSQWVPSGARATAEG